MAGVTTVRDLAAPLQPILAVKKRIASGEIPGPTVYVAGPALTKGANPNAVQTWNVSGAADARAKTSQLIDAGVDWIKVINADALTPEEMKAIVDEAHARGRKVAAHAFSEAEIRRGLIAGVDDFQHVRTQTPEYAPDVVALIRDRVRSGPPLYWTVTAGANGQLNAALPRIESGVPGRSGEFHRTAATDRGRCAQGHRRQDSGRHTPRRRRSESGRDQRDRQTEGRPDPRPRRADSCSGRTSGAGVRSPGRRPGWRRISGSASSVWTR